MPVLVENKDETVTFLTCIPEAFDSKLGRDPNYLKRGIIWDVKANYKVLHMIKTGFFFHSV